MGAHNPLHNTMGKLDFRLVQQFATYTKQDPFSTQVCPIPVSILKYLNTLHQSVTKQHQGISDLTWISLFSLLQLG